MDLLGKLELFSHTPENRFIFSLFDLLLCGVIVLVIVRGWRARKSPFSAGNRLFLLLAFLCLGGSFGLEAVSAGAFFFLRVRLPESPVDLLFHAFQASAWVLMIASTYAPANGRPRLVNPTSLPGWLLFLPFASWLAVAPLKVTVALDLTNLILVGAAFIGLRRRPGERRMFVTGAIGLVFVAATLQLSSGLTSDVRASLILWNGEQAAWSFSLFAFALGIGEASRDLFDKVFVRLQIAFILLASLMILVITQTEKADYLAGIRDRSRALAEFVRDNVDYLRKQEDPLAVIVEREDFLQRAILGFGNLPELKVIRIGADSETATFEIADNGEIYSGLDTNVSPSRLESEEYFLIHALPLAAARKGTVEFYGTREFIDRHIRKRIVLIFSLFTGMVMLSTVMIGLVVRGASTVIHNQAQEIENAQQQLAQTSKLAAIGELAAGVAHEINNPATTILSMASFWLSEENGGRATCDAEDVREVMDQAQRIADITGDLLTFSRRQALNIKPTPIDNIITNSLRLIDDSLTASRISVEKNVEPGLRVLADEGALVRALENLFRNAIDAMPAGGVLRIKAASENSRNSRIRIEVADTGIGIKKEDLPRIFDPFFTTKEVGRGTGLGLSIVHGIIKEHQGTISVESEPGAGATFTVILPAEEAQ